MGARQHPTRMFRISAIPAPPSVTLASARDDPFGPAISVSPVSRNWFVVNVFMVPPSGRVLPAEGLPIAGNGRVRAEELEIEWPRDVRVPVTVARAAHPSRMRSSNPSKADSPVGYPHIRRPF